DGSTLHAFAGTDPDAAAPYVAITGDLDGQPPGRWAVRDTDPANPGVLSQAASTVVAGDADGDSISDGPLRPILQQQWDVALEPAGRAVLTIVTRFGIAAPRDVVT
ncbi:MAG: hypothetical protein M3N52_05110, partial [Actinomycetota bacterium]|nr:hypothetical protein [Actinomycetota bacterium]